MSQSGTEGVPERPHPGELVGKPNDVLLVTALASFIPPFMASALNLAVPAIGAEFGAPAVVVNWVLTSYLVASAACLLPFARLGDVVGRRRLFLLGAGLLSAFSLACAAAPSVWALVAARLLQGAGGAIGAAVGMALLTAAFPAAQRGRVLGIATAAVYVGLSVGPVAGGFLTQHLGWRSVFVANALLGVLVMAFTAARMRGEWRDDQARFDLPGAAAYVAGLATLMAGASSLRTLSFAPWLILAGGVVLVVSLLHQLRTPRPLLDLRLFRNVVFAFSNLAALLNYSATFAISFLLSLYLQVVRGLPPSVAGMILLAQPIVMAALSPLAGRVSDRVQPRIVASAGMGLTSIALVLFAFVSASTAVPLVIAELALAGLGFALFSSPNTNAVMSSVDVRSYGVGAATLGTMRLVGQACSMALAALVMASLMGSARIDAHAAPTLLVAIRTTFAISAALCGAGVFASLARGHVHHGA
jgi:EmrB/QacA subfamily drug resistance transporter